ncbi:hypothetical protein ACFWAX_42295, partial [Streptomyces sp. NPDC059956]
MRWRTPLLSDASALPDQASLDSEFGLAYHERVRVFSSSADQGIAVRPADRPKLAPLAVKKAATAAPLRVLLNGCELS